MFEEFKKLYRMALLDDLYDSLEYMIEEEFQDMPTDTVEKLLSRIDDLIEGRKRHFYVP